MTLLSNKRFAFDVESQREGDGVERGKKFMLGSVTRAISVDVIPPSTTFKACRIINFHFDSLWNTLSHRAKQMEILANLLHEPGCDGGLIAGDFNAIRPEDHTLLEKNGLEDAWLAVHGRDGANGTTWGVGVQRKGGLGLGRLDKIAMLGLEAKEMEILRPGMIERPKPGEPSDHIPYSDHFGLRLGFTF
ncbi:hypothetical protein AGABI2DRAFT_194291 [Agaricus bisporus var. bisporus H97]|uniref:hypothetical protein n=1 Tax=Agaricus bisporus var. bisporus (strain H97 / ATCC MYA-4626 / FGSC 10389) TaxID=936046 RepID=UPI00029F6581|nr:hypothetical protein AGABI2DRAFT_194291 [Agaricus bisporus var. bisporus H97]EKV45337.1 hypothetical protein AGABI2DRAFT_194291 [Agaricus bisporus var. bisporus H97]